MNYKGNSKKYDSWTIWWPLIIGGTILYRIFYYSDAGKTTASLPPPSVETVDQSKSIPTQGGSSFWDTTPSEVSPSFAPGVSLSTGTILKSRGAYLNGEGQLKISNGTSYDAVAKLIIDGTSVLTVYIKAGDTYAIKNIADGTYWLAFSQGADWNSSTKKFNRSAHTSAFDDTFEFVTTETQSSGWSVTLNTTAGGTARASDVDQSQFDQY